MKVDITTGSRRRSLAGWSILAAVCLVGGVASEAGAPLGPSKQPEAYFNGTAYVRLSKPLSLKQLVGLNFRSCVGGELFSQRFEGHTLHVTALFEQIVVTWARPGQSPRSAGLQRETLDNQWHWIALRYKPAPPQLLLEVDRDDKLIANLSYNSELLSGAGAGAGAGLAGGGGGGGGVESGGAVLLVGNLFRGCILEGPQLEFHEQYSTLHNVVFGKCPLSTAACKDRNNVLRIPPDDHCYNEPCLRHGTCISRHDRYECHCTARYTGQNCEIEVGPPCARAPCRHRARCQELPTGDFVCHCTDNYHGKLCEIPVSLEGACESQPCRNNGSCSAARPPQLYVCECLPGFTGRDCETDIDECLSGSCQHGGRCLDQHNNYTCDCTDTGYTGARCEQNINECLTEPSLCGPGVCYDTHGGYVCACPPHLAGEHCELPATVSPQTCADLVCSNNAHCAIVSVPNMSTGVVMKQAMCVCDSGFYGAASLSPECSELERACAAGACQHGAACSVHRDRLNCSCTPGYTGVYCERETGGAGAGGGASGGGASGGGVGSGGGASGAGAASVGTGKALGELTAAPERCATGPCRHALVCRDHTSGFRCECEPGWTGSRCSVPAAGSPGAACGAGGGAAGAGGCPPAHYCAELGGAWRCQPATAVGPCADLHCNNGTCLATDSGVARCLCPPGIEGSSCEVDVNECALSPKICHNGVCVNVVGSYQCYCRPGYTGDNCELDIDECLSSPCKNGGVCHNLENNYECTCPEGFEGKDCSLDIDECLSSPCAEGSTCADGVAGFTCVCQQGLTGPTCHTDIDDCASSPCGHGGRCVDGLDSFTCECAGTGYTGPTCADNIDECQPQPCRNHATCLDHLNDYLCVCHPGYTGKNCEIDIDECESSPCKYDGICLQHSNASLYVARDAPPVMLAGYDREVMLPDYFHQPFTYERANGFSCVCVEGTVGARCEENIDECASSPCSHGKCVDGVGSYACVCQPGYEGRHCEVDIDECARYTPCLHGRCQDERAAYVCVCEAGWGGRNCSVTLQGCRSAPCRNHGTCRPWLRHETDHLFNCSCAPGHHGDTCEKVTTMSLEKSSYAEVNTTREEGYDISFRFKTTLGNALLAMGKGLTYFFLELSNGRLNLHSSLLNKWEGVFIGSNLNDSNWQKVFVTINSSHVVLAANEEQTIYPISQNDPYNSSMTSFSTTRLGTAGSSYAPLTHGPNFFVGCFQDVVINNQWVLPEDSNSTSEEATTESSLEEESPRTRMVLSGVRAQCARTPQCAPNPCRAGGVCDDAWSSFSCTCPRPQLGHTCQYNYTAATFGQESAKPRSIVRVAVREAARRAVHAALDISMFIRTRKPRGYIFYLGSIPRYGQTDETLVGASLKGGELLVHLRFNHTPEDYTVGGTRLDNGHLHLIQVVRNSTLVQVKLNGTEYFRKSISAAKQLDAQVLYLGGPPPAPSPPPPPPPASEPPPASSPAPPLPGASLPPPTSPAPPAEVQPDDEDYFKGVIQDVQISNGVNVTVVEFFPLAVEGLQVPPPFGVAQLDPAGVLRGEVSDDVCASVPCQHNATCHNTWNDYTCSCPRGYKGKQCAEVEFCQLQGCPLYSHCRNLDAGYECVSNATFDGVNTSMTYQLRVPRTPLATPPGDTPPGDTPRPPQPPTTLSIVYRTKYGGTMFHATLAGGAEGQSSWFTVGVYKEQVSLQWRLAGVSPGDAGASPGDAGASPGAAGGLPTVRRLRARDHLDWTTLSITLHPLSDTLTAGFVDAEGLEETVLTAGIDVAAWQRLMMQGTIHLGGVTRMSSPPLTTEDASASMTENSTDGAVFEYSEGDDFNTDNLVGQYFKGCMGAVHIGGMLLPYFPEEELLVGGAAKLLEPTPHYVLLSGRGWGWSLGVDCVLCVEAECVRGHCASVRASYSCDCPAGYQGERCETDVDECAGVQCEHGGTCHDGVANYTCACAPGYTGPLCEEDIDECLSAPCEHGGACRDVAGGFQCACAGSWRGARCQLPPRTRCQHEPCARGRCSDTHDLSTGNNYTCLCPGGFSGAQCEHAYCELTPCVHGDCRVTEQSAWCECWEGYSGPLCSVERDTCVDSPAECLHGGVCVPTRPTAGCDCTGTGYEGARCETDVDECASGAVSCRPGDCVNTPGGYTCVCAHGFCGNECALRDPCFEPGVGGVGGSVAGGEGEGVGGNVTGPCQHGGACAQRCGAAPDYTCRCPAGWGGKNCTHQISAEAAGGGAGGGGGGATSSILIGAGCALLALALLGAGAAVLAAQARRKRATRGTYSPSGQEYCNPRAPHHAALKPPPEERLI